MICSSLACDSGARFSFFWRDWNQLVSLLGLVELAAKQRCEDFSQVVDKGDKERDKKCEQLCNRLERRLLARRK
jgi:hypothetical protein